ncbi:MAG: hypothetical protein SF029_20025 [bacterium]|nr:hypothetical protein [bacterium]
MLRRCLPLMMLAWVICTAGVVLAGALGRVLRGDLIAFETRRDGNAEIYLLDLNTRALYNFTRHPASDTAPVWSPDGEQLAFISQREGARRLWVADLQGRMRPVTPPGMLAAGTPGDVSWSEDGRTLLYLWQEGRRSIIYRVDLEADTPPREISQASPAAQAYLNRLRPRWQGIYAAPGDSNRSAAMEQIGGRWWLALRENVAEGDANPAITLVEVSEYAVFVGSRPQWSPSGETLAYYDLTGLTLDLFVIAARPGAVPRQLTFDGGMAPAWRPR